MCAQATATPAPTADPTPKTKRPDAYQIATDAILAALDRGTIPWRKPWSEIPGRTPRNAITGRSYRGVNVLLLGMAGYDDPRWITFAQAKKAGGMVRKGEKSTPVLLWKRTRKRLKTDADVASARAEGRRIEADAQGRRYAVLFLARLFRVFNSAQVDGLDLAPISKDEPMSEWEAVGTCDEIVRGYTDGPSIYEGGNSASYAPCRDHVQMPGRGQFSAATDWHATLFHELAHSTGHPSRLNRDDLTAGHRFGTKGYAREELTAELAASMLCAVAGIDSAPLTERSAAYIDHWRQAISDDARLVVVAAQRAQRAADRILGHDPAADAADTSQAGGTD
ncbi:MAG: zincin-like metallopeptidase domain-containing protein [Solirubrobacteraceae bacterium]|nr:zincin-like metallopeptidase domain-containing protein [Solirubrobacteraceae bacterium]